MLVEHKPEIIEWVEVWEKQQTIPIRQMPAMTVKCVATTLSWESEIVKRHGGAHGHVMANVSGTVNGHVMTNAKFIFNN